MILGAHDQIVGAWAEAPSGPGWSNRLIWVCVRDALNGRHRVEALQPEAQSEEILLGFGMHLASSAALIGAVERLAAKLTKPARLSRKRGERPR